MLLTHCFSHFALGFKLFLIGNYHNKTTEATFTSQPDHQTFTCPRGKFTCLTCAIRPTILVKIPQDTLQNANWRHILKCKVIICQTPLSPKICWNSGSTLDESTSTLCWGWGGRGGQKDQVQSVPRLLNRLVPRNRFSFSGRTDEVHTSSGLRLTSCSYHWR